VASMKLIGSLKESVSWLNGGNEAPP
jgi:hypothetical protein